MDNSILYETGGYLMAEILRYKLKKAYKHYLNEFGMSDESKNYLFFSLAMYGATRDVVEEFGSELTDLLRSLGEANGDFSEYAEKIGKAYHKHILEDTE